MIGTFLWIIAAILLIGGYVGLAGWALFSVIEVLASDGHSRPWRRCIAVVAAFVVVTAGGITAIASVVDESCPAGTTREYKATGYKQGYHYCLARTPQ